MLITCQVSEMIRILLLRSSRSIRFDYAETVRVDGARGYKYKMGQNLVNGSAPENSCYNPLPSPDLVRGFFLPFSATLAK